MKTPAVVLLLVALILTTLSASSSPRGEQVVADLTYKAYVPGVGSDAHRDVPPAPTINVTSQGDAQRAVTVLVTAEDGGVVEATGADGSHFTLTIPAGALLFDEFVTMTPIVSMTGLPAGLTLTGGVILQPDGLELAIPARLEVDSGPAPDLRIGVFHEGDSGQLTPAVVEVADGPTTLLLPHFSTWGEANGSYEQVGLVMDQVFAEGPVSWAAAAGETSNQAGVAVQQGQPLEQATDLFYDALRAKWPVTFQPALNAAQQAAAAGARPFPQAYSAIAALEAVRLMSPPPRPDDIVNILIDAETQALQTVNAFMTTALERCNANRTPQNIEDVKSLARRMKLAWGSEVLAPYDFSLCQGERWVGTMTYYEEHRDSLGSLVTYSVFADVGFDGFKGSLEFTDGSELSYEYSYRNVSIDSVTCTYSSNGTKAIGPFAQNATWPAGRMTVLGPEQGSQTGLWRYQIESAVMGPFATVTMACSTGYTGPITFWPMEWFSFDLCGTSLLTFRTFDPALGRISGAFEGTISTSPHRSCRSTWDLRLE